MIKRTPISDKVDTKYNKVDTDFYKLDSELLYWDSNFYKVDSCQKSRLRKVNKYKGLEGVGTRYKSLNKSKYKNNNKID